MTTQNSDLDTPDEAELLLPWYVTGKISDQDRAKVDLWLETHPQAGAHLQRAIEELDLTFTASEQLATPSRANLDRLMAEVGPGAAAAGPGLAERLWGLLSPRYALAGIAALGLVVIGQGVALTLLSQQNANLTYATASSQAPRGAELTALVAFTPETSLEAISATFEDLGLKIVDGPKPGGIYLVAAPDSDAGKKALETLAANTALVRFFSHQ